ncbi:MAG: hypothetical protein GWN85_38780 [Gemmatimonadetes bacterium]|nr:hypothetical protein [Gemmatimonadota bacterium]
MTATVKSGGSAVELGRSHLAGVSSPVLSLTALMAGLTALLSLRLAFPRRAPKATAATM